MADKKISALTSASTPLAGTEVLPIVQSGATVKVAISNVTAGRAVSALSYASSTGATFATSSGQVGVGLTPSAWHTVVVKAVELGRAGSAIYAQTNNNTVNVTSNAYFDNAGWKYGTTSTASYYSQYDGDHSWWTAPSGTADTAVSFTQRMVLYRDTGNLLLNTGNLVINTSGKGIDFSATPGTGTSELLADYEEGTWTPSVGGNATYTIQEGYYVKVGNLVYVQCQLILNVLGTGSATTIDGLPFTALNPSNSSRGTGSVWYCGSLATGVTCLAPGATPNGTTITFGGFTVLGAGTTMSVPLTVFQNGTRVDFSMTYRAN